jgi:hypothetical protein
MIDPTAYQKRHAKARQRRRLRAQERLARDRRQAQQTAEALQQALDDLGLPENLVAEIEGRLRSQHKLLGKIVGVMFPPLFGCRTNTGLCRVRGWDKNLPSRVLGALPKRSWLKRLRRLGLEVLVRLWRVAASKSTATRSRWQWTWVADDSVFKKYGKQLGLVGPWWSGQEHRVCLGIGGVLLVVVIGEGKLVVPADFAIRRPDPTGPGGPCRDKLHWIQSMLDGRGGGIECALALERPVRHPAALAQQREDLIEHGIKVHARPSACLPGRAQPASAP